ncbi:hypothetical protein SAMN04489722_11062 [Algibacter lectus]|nr:hypothetical protein SAMN04489722_11062 [Algibacter lectus]
MLLLHLSHIGIRKTRNRGIYVLLFGATNINKTMPKYEIIYNYVRFFYNKLN